MTSCLAPSTNGKRIIFPLRLTSGIYNTNFFYPSLVDNRMNPQEFQDFIGEIHKETNSMYVIRSYFKRLFRCLFVVASLIVLGAIILGAGNFQYYSGAGGIVGGAFISGGIGLLIIFSVLNGVYTTTQIPFTHKIIVDIIARNNIKFQSVGLRWAAVHRTCRSVIPGKLGWLELWMDYKEQSYSHPSIAPNNYSHLSIAPDNSSY